ncbi:hypothetical protein OZD68_06295 [Wolbachia endosymbiont of Drosophila bicornuta]|uniref:hypothetical protein n=1 Tax=Wolbachia TaxID=953 RepID=UPI0015FD3BE6|nr:MULTISPECIES: hypothetical protein [Wolbachia]MBA8754827.1 hypothetical protein [Wolbachia pipientis]MDE5057159.1 hypothetical protein [Wolbachia endosymbiont of Drosophila bicornuta]
MLLLYHSHKHISYPIRTIARSAIITKVGNENSGLVQSLNNLQTKVEELENNTINEPDWG